MEWAKEEDNQERGEPEKEGLKQPITDFLSILQPPIAKADRETPTDKPDTPTAVPEVKDSQGETPIFQLEEMDAGDQAAPKVKRPKPHGQVSELKAREEYDLENEYLKDNQDDSHGEKTFDKESENNLEASKSPENGKTGHGSPIRDSYDDAREKEYLENINFFAEQKQKEISRQAQAKKAILAETKLQAGGLEPENAVLPLLSNRVSKKQSSKTDFLDEWIKSIAERVGELKLPKAEIRFFNYLINACVRLGKVGLRGKKDYVSLILRTYKELVNPLARTIRGMNCLHAGAEEGQVRATISIIKYLKSISKNGNKEASRWTQFTSCCRAKKRNVVQAVTGKDDYNIQDSINMVTGIEGQTPLHLAAIRSNLTNDTSRVKRYERLVEIFLKYGADPELYDVRSWTAADYCQQPYSGLTK